MVYRELRDRCATCGSRAETVQLFELQASGWLKWLKQSSSERQLPIVRCLLRATLLRLIMTKDSIVWCVCVVVLFMVLMSYGVLLCV